MWKYFPLEVKSDKLHKIEHMYIVRVSKKTSAILANNRWQKLVRPFLQNASFLLSHSLNNKVGICTEEGLLFCLLSGSALPHSLQKVLLLATT